MTLQLSVFIASDAIEFYYNAFITEKYENTCVATINIENNSVIQKEINIKVFIDNNSFEKAYVVSELVA